MPITLERYVDIQSAVIGGAQAQARSLIGLRFTSNPLVPADAQVIARDAASVGAYFGLASLEYAFARDYFAYRSKQPVNRPSALRFAAHVSTARPPRIYGAPDTYTVQQFTAITDGAFGLAMGEVDAQVEGVNLSAVTSLADVATALQTAIRAVPDGGPVFAQATVSYDPVRAAFVLTGGADGNAAVQVSAPEEGTDISFLLGWDNPLTIRSAGAAAETSAQSLTRANQLNDSFGSFSFGSLLPVAEQVEVAQLNANYNVKYMFLAWTVPQQVQALATALSPIPSTGVHVNGLATAQKFNEALPAAILATIDFTARNSLPNFMFQQNPLWNGIAYSDVSDDQVANLYDPLRINYYGATATAGQDILFYQRGYLGGSATALQDMTVHAGEQWLKAQAKADLMNLLLGLNSIPANNDGRGLVMAALTGGVIEMGLLNGTIIAEKAFTVTQKAAVTELSGDANAWQQVQTAGYWLDARVVSEAGPSNLTEYKIVYTLIYSKRDVVRKIEGSHNLV